MKVPFRRRRLHSSAGPPTRKSRRHTRRPRTTQRFGHSWSWVAAVVWLLVMDQERYGGIHALVLFLPTRITRTTPGRLDGTRIHRTTTFLTNRDPKDDTATATTTTTPIIPVVGTFSQFPEDIFAELSSSSDETIGRPELAQWEELQELISDQDLSPHELEAMMAALAIVSPNNNNNDPLRLDLAGFVQLYEQIEDLFVYEEDTTDDDATTTTSTTSDTTEENAPPNLEEQLLLYLKSVTPTLPSDDAPQLYRLPCGMDCTEEEHQKLKTIMNALEQSPTNLVLQQSGTVLVKDLLGEWELLYTNSQAMITNKSLSGLVGSPLNKADFSGVRQRYTGSKFLGFVAFLETFNAGTDEAFEVQIEGEWELQPNRNYYTSQPATMIKVDPTNIEYGAGYYSMTEQAPVVQLGGGLSQAASWQSLGPIKLLDIIYMTANLQIVRGNSNPEALFVWKRCP